MDRRNDPTPQPPPPATPRPTLATPFAWVGGSLLLTGTTFLVSIVALFRAFGSLFH
jgi:hypothetical protein